MRSVAYPNFCHVCLEGLWLSLLNRIDLIDDIHESCISDFASEAVGHRKKVLELDLIQLGQFKKEPRDADGAYTITWSTKGRVLDQFTNQTRIEVEGDAASYDIAVAFSTREVRRDAKGWLTASRSHKIKQPCEWCDAIGIIF